MSTALLALVLAGAPMTSTIELKKTADTGTFARYLPFDDGREVIVRRGKELGFQYGIPQGRRKVKVKGGEFECVKFMAIISPPAMRPGDKPMSEEAAKNFKPLSEVVFLPDAEVLIRREPKGFSDAEVEKILAAISVK